MNKYIKCKHNQIIYDINTTQLNNLTDELNECKHQLLHTDQMYHDIKNKLQNKIRL